MEIIENTKIEIINLKAAAKLVYQLGEQLIESEIVAIMELIKNSYDADATRVSVEVDTNIMTPYGKGLIRIKDNGNGMTKKILKEDFFKIATSFKELNRYSSKFQRRVLGEKGLGRLSFQRLGYYIKVKTKPSREIFKEIVELENQESLCYELLIDWRGLNSGLELHEVTAELKEIPSNSIKNESGTEIEILGIRNINFWQGNNREKKAIIQEIYKMNPPIVNDEMKDTFKVILKVDDERFSNQEINENILKGLCDSKIDFTYKNGEFTIEADLSEKYIKNLFDKSLDRWLKKDVDLDKENLNITCNNSNKLEELRSYKVNIDINKIIKYLAKNKQVELSSEETEYLKYVKNSGINLIDGQIIAPGNFWGKIYNIRFGIDNKKGIGDYLRVKSLDNIKDYNSFKAIWDQVQGFYIYRNSFRILPYGDKGFDWAGFDEYSKKIGYGPYEYKSILGYIILDGKSSENLREQTNRQGLVRDEYGDNFLKLVKNIFVFIICDKVNKITKGFELKKSKNNTIETINGIYSIEQPEAHYEEAVKKIEVVRKEFNYLKEEIIKNHTKKITNEEDKNEKILKIEKITPFIEKINEDILKTQENITKAYIEKKYEMNTLKAEKEEMAELIPMVGQSLIVEAMTHEFNRIASNISENARKTIKALDENMVKENIKKFQNSIITETIFLEEQLEHLEPTYKRNNTLVEVINLKSLLNDLYIKESPMARKAKINEVKVTLKGEEFFVNANKGFLITIFDNLFLNSLYWVTINKNKMKEIIIELHEDGRVIFSDSGPGIEKNMEKLIFKPFISNKPDGRGLGLYIVESLLNEMNANIKLDSQENEEKRLTKFILTFNKIEKKNTLF